jgi:hypothetical protein
MNVTDDCDEYSPGKGDAGGTEPHREDFECTPRHDAKCSSNDRVSAAAAATAPGPQVSTPRCVLKCVNPIESPLQGLHRPLPNHFAS